MAYRAREVEDTPLKLAAVLMIVILWQAAFGAWTVTLKLWPQVVTGHLIGGFTTLSLMWLLFIRQGGLSGLVAALPLAELAGKDRFCCGGRADHFGWLGFELRCAGLL